MSSRQRRRSGIVRIYREARRRRVLRVAGLYIIGAWVILQVADVAFPGLGIPEAAIRGLLIAVVLGFPIALVFGWLFDIGPDGIQRTPSLASDDAAAPGGLRRSDYLVLAGLALVATIIVSNAIQEVLRAPGEHAPGTDTAGLDVGPVPKLENSVAVLPFTNLSANPDNNYFSVGVAEEILNRLGAFKELNVIGRTSSFALEGRKYPASKIAALLGAEFLLQGSVRRHRDQVRVSTQLLNAQGVQLWTANFDRELENVFAIQTEIAESVARTIVPRIVPQAAEGEQPNIDAYQAFLRGRDLLHKRMIPEAIPHLERAIALDPGFAKAHAELAATVLIGMPDEADIERARSAIDRALSLSPGLLRALEVRGLMLNQKDPPDHAAAEAVLREVLARDPDRPDALLWLSITLFAQGRDEEAEPILERGVRIDPLHPSLVGNWANTLLERGQKTQAEEVLLPFIENVETGGPHMVLRTLYWETGQFVKMNRSGKRVVLDFPAGYVTLYFNYLLLGDGETASEWAMRLERDFPELTFAGFWGVRPAQMQGHYREAVDEIDRGMAARGWTVQDLPPYFKLWYGRHLALAGEFEKAVEILEPIVDLETSWSSPGAEPIQLTLAWAQFETGNVEAANALLEGMEQQERISLDQYDQALIAILRNQEDRALDHLEAAVDAGWREYYSKHHDPRWDPVRDHPRFQALMAAVKADVDAMRAEVEKMDAEEDFLRKVDESGRWTKAMSKAPGKLRAGVQGQEA